MRGLKTLSVAAACMLPILSATPAFADAVQLQAPQAGVALASATATGGTVKGTCTFTGTVSPSGLTIVYAGDAQAVGAAVATGIACRLSTGGGGATALPGAAAATAGVADAPFTRVTVRACAYALFVDGSTAGALC